MASTYSTNLALELIATGEQSGTWGTTTNTNLGTLIEQAISGYVTQAITDGADTTITIPNGATGVARNMYIEMTGALTAARNLIVPANKKLYFIYNNTTGGFAVTVKVSGQTGVSVSNGAKVLLVVNGTDVVVAVNTISGTLKLFGATSGSVGLVAAAAAGSTTYTLPSADGTRGQALTTNGSATLSWGTPLPAGSLLDFAGTAAPSGFLGCDGSAVSRATYAALFTAIGTTWGAGDGSTTFNLPNFQRRVAVGSGGSGTGTLGNAVGNTGGAETHTLITGEMPSHTHGVGRTDLQVAGGVGGGYADSGSSNGASTSQATGGGGAHNNMQPSAVVLKIIKT